MQLNAASLDKFVEKTDDLGGPGSEGCAEFWSNLQYEPSVSVDKQVNPLSANYRNQQMALYQEITGHAYSDSRDEFTPGVPVEKLLNAPNAYDHASPAGYAEHCVALGILVRKLDLPRGAKILELGSGWGVTQEFFASCGFETVGLDANPDFVATSNARLERLGFGRRVAVGTFDDLNSKKFGMFDGVVAYEAFHHAVDALDLLRRSVECLGDAGVMALAGEPFNNYYCSWGLRLDPYSIYCVRKFGWFESGWSAEYMAYLFGRCGLSADFDDLPGSGLTRYMVGRRSVRRTPLQLGMWHPSVRSSLHAGSGPCFTKEESSILVPFTGSIEALTLEVVNFSTRPLVVNLHIGDIRREFCVPVGTDRLKMPCHASGGSADVPVEIESETFCPAEEGINTDGRTLGICIEGVELNYLVGG